MTSFEPADQIEIRSASVTALPRVKDLTQAAPRVTIESDGSGVYDMLMTIWVIFDEDEDRTGFEMGVDWFSAVKESVPSDLAKELIFLGGPGGEVWLVLAGMIAVSPYPHDIKSVLNWLESVDPMVLRSGILLHTCGPQTGDDLVVAEKAAGGDDAALEELLATGRLADNDDAASGYRELLTVPMPEIRDRLVSSLTRFQAEVYAPFEEKFTQATTQGAAARRALARGAEPERVIEEVTNGLDYRIQPGVSRLVLIPSVVLRPWAVIDQHLDTLAIFYPVADEFLDADADAPPSWVVKLHKALGDEKRLRILRRLSEGTASLDDLSDMLGVAKSTVHHHVGQLRAAGLVRVTLDHSKNKNYTIRPAVLPEAARTLSDYLRTGPESTGSES